MRRAFKVNLSPWEYISKTWLSRNQDDSFIRTFRWKMNSIFSTGKFWYHFERGNNVIMVRGMKTEGKRVLLRQSFVPVWFRCYNEKEDWMMGNRGDHTSQLIPWKHTQWLPSLSQSVLNHCTHWTATDHESDVKDEFWQGSNKKQVQLFSLSPAESLDCDS